MFFVSFYPFLPNNQGEYIRDNPLDGQIVPVPGNPSWLQHSNGSPFFMAGPGDPEGFLYRGHMNPDGTRNGDQLDLIKKLSLTGANSFYLMAVRSHGGDGNFTENPFLNNNPGEELNRAILEQWEKWFSKMDEAGIVIFFIFYDDGSKIWNTGHKVGEAERKFIHTLVNSFEHHKNLIWCVAEEYQEAYSSMRIRNIALEIRNADNYDHVIAVHKLSGLNFSEFAQDFNIDQFAIQYKSVNPAELNAAANKAWRKAKGLYNLNFSETPYLGKGKETRKKYWAMAMGGAYVMAFGVDIKNTDVEDLKELGKIVNFFQSIDYYKMSPHNELSFAGTEYILSDPGESYLLYTSKTVKQIGVHSLLAGIYNFKWFDIDSGKIMSVDNIKVSGGTNAWEIPIDFGYEIVLYIIRKS